MSLREYIRALEAIAEQYGDDLRVVSGEDFEEVSEPEFYAAGLAPFADYVFEIKEDCVSVG